MEPIFLVGGSGRSGTTILSKLLATHPQLTETPETRFLVDPGGICDFYNVAKTWTPYNAHYAFADLERVLKQVSSTSTIDRIIVRLEKKLKELLPQFRLSARYSSLEICKIAPSFETLVKDYLNSIRTCSYPMNWVGMERFEKYCFNHIPDQQRETLLATRQFLENYFADVCKSLHSDYYFEKNTWNILHYKTINEIYPNLKLVHIVRDPYDVILSYMQQSWMPCDVKVATSIYVDIMTKWLREKAQYPYNYIEVKFEDLVRKPFEIMSKIYQFFNLPYTDDWKIIPLAQPKSRRESNRNIKIPPSPELSTILSHYQYEQFD